MKEGGLFMQREDLDAHDLVKIANLFSVFLVLDIHPTEKLKKYSKIVPKYVMDMAKESRVDEGLQLIARSSRHYKCSRFGSLLHDTVGFSKLKNVNIGISIKKVVPASFKTDMYTTEAAFTSTAIIACKCSFAAGSEEVNHHNRHVDVHILPLVMIFMELFMNPSCRLAESIPISRLVGVLLKTV